MKTFVRNINNLWGQIPEQLVYDNSVIFGKTWVNFALNRTFMFLPLHSLKRLSTKRESDEGVLMLDSVYFSIIKAFIIIGKKEGIEFLESYIAKKLFKHNLTGEIKLLNEEVNRSDLAALTNNIDEIIGCIVDELQEDMSLNEIPKKYMLNTKYKHAVIKEGVSDSSDYVYYRKTLYKPLLKTLTKTLNTVLDLGYNPISLLYYYLDKADVPAIINAKYDRNVFQEDLFNDTSSFKLKTYDEFKRYLNEKK